MPFWKRLKQPKEEVDRETSEIRFHGKLVGVDLVPWSGMFSKPALTQQDKEFVLTTCLQSINDAKALLVAKKKRKQKVDLILSVENGITITHRHSEKEVAAYHPSVIYYTTPDIRDPRICAFVVRGTKCIEVVVFKTDKNTTAEKVCGAVNKLFDACWKLVKEKARRQQLAMEAAMMKKKKEEAKNLIDLTQE